MSYVHTMIMIYVAAVIVVIIMVGRGVSGRTAVSLSVGPLSDAGRLRGLL